MDHVLDVQGLQLSNTQHHLRLSEELQEVQKSNLLQSEHLHDTSSQLASELEGATQVAGRMSIRLEHVNQALTRVERASAVLSTLIKLVALPARLCEILHLRLLGVFAMPTAILYFCRPRMYSYILISVYGKHTLSR